MPFHYVSRRAQVIRSYYSGIGKTAVIYPATFLTAVGIGVLVLGLVFYLKDTFGASDSLIGLNAALWSLSYIIGCLFLRPLSERIAPRYILMTGSFFMAVFVFCTLKAPSLPLAIASNCLTGLAMAHFWPPVMGWLSSNLAGDELSRVMSRFNLSWSIGGVISPWLGGWLSDLDTALPLYESAGLFLLTSVLITGGALTLPRVREEKVEIPENSEDDDNSGEGTPLRFAGWVGVFAAFMAMGLTGYIFPSDAQDRLHIAKTIIGLLLLSRSATSVATFAFMGRTRVWHNRAPQMVIGLLGIVGFLLIMPACTRPLTIAPALAFLGVLSAQAYFNSLFHGLEGASNRAGRSALHEALLNGGIITGAAVGGLITDHFSMNVAYRFFAGVILVAAIIQTLISLRLSGRFRRSVSE